MQHKIYVPSSRAGRGRNTWGQLGAGDDEDRLDDPNQKLVAVDLDGSSPVAIAAGEAHVCIIDKNKSVKVCEIV